LGPGDAYAPRYYDTSWQPVYLTSPVATDRFVNIGVPGAVTVIPAQSFGQVVYPQDIVRVDPQVITQVRPVLDPLTVNPLRQAAFETRRAERQFAISQAIAQRLNNTPVVVAQTPTARPFKRDLASAMRVEEVGWRAKRQQLQLRDERAATNQQGQPQAPNVGAEQAREKQMADLARQAARGDRGARQQMQESRKQQLQESAPNQQAQGQQLKHARVDGVANQQAQGQRVGQPAAPAQNQRQIMREQQRAQRDAERQQTINNQQLRQAGVKAEAKAGKPERTQRAAPQPQPARPQIVRPEPQRGRKPEVQVQRQPSQPQVMSAPRPQPVQQPQPQVERRGPPAQGQPHAQQQQQRIQQQAKPQPQPQAQLKGGGQGKGQGKPGKKP
jgi:hypothetical protein